MKVFTKRHSPAYLFTAVMLAIFIAEFVDMTLLDWLHNKWNISSFVLINLMDSSILVVLVYPFLYFLTFKPLIAQIKERTRMAGIIKKSEEEWDTIFNSITDMVSIHDSNFIIKKANESFLKFTGMNRDDVTGRRCYTLVHGTNQPFCNCPHERCLKSREHEILEIEDERTSLSLLVSVSPVFDKDGNFLYSVHIAKDISELKQVEKELRVKSYILERMNKNLTIMVDEEVKKRRQQEQLLIQQSKQASMGEVVGMIAHQWKQPLNAISLTVEDLQDASDFGEIDKDYVRRANTAVMQQVGFMSKTIDDFRTFLIPSRTQRPFDIKKAIEDIVGMFGSLYKKKNNIEIIIETTTPESNFTTIGFPNEFKQVILNLINNSSDAIVSRAESSGKKFIGDIKIELSHSDNKIYVNIRDNGGGIPVDVIDKIYEPYVSTKSEEKGTGLGLYMSKTIIETNMSGTLTVKNVDGGAEFLIMLNAAE